jgi:reverse gyrase
MDNYPKSRLRLLAVAVAALPPAYLLLKSNLIISMKARGICRPADSVATTQ